jgi:hypothetical protein
MTSTPKNTDIDPSTDPMVEVWEYGTVTAALDYRFGKILAIVADWLPDPDDGAAFDPIELDWRLFCGDLKARYGTVPAMGEPEYVPEDDVWAYQLDMPAL